MDLRFEAGGGDHPVKFEGNGLSKRRTVLTTIAYVFTVKLFWSVSPKPNMRASGDLNYGRSLSVLGCIGSEFPLVENRPIYRIIERLI